VQQAAVWRVHRRKAWWAGISNPWLSAGSAGDAAAMRRVYAMSESTPDKRGRWREYHALCDAIRRRWHERCYQQPLPRCPPYPADLIGLACGAKTRAGTPCKITTLYFGGRCKWHGGMSSGPKTEVGKEQSRINGRKGGRPKKEKPKS